MWWEGETTGVREPTPSQLILSGPYCGRTGDCCSEHAYSGTVCILAVEGHGMRYVCEPTHLSVFSLCRSYTASWV